MPSYVLTGPASIDSLLGVPSCLSAFVIVFPFTLSTMFLATFGGPDGALPTHEVHTLVLEMSLLPLKICCDDTLVTPICIHVPEFWHVLKINGILVNRRSTTWQGLSADSSVGVRVGSRRRGDPKLGQRIFKVSSGSGKGSHGRGKSGQRRKRRELAAVEKGGKGEAISSGVHERRSAALEEKTAQRHRRTITRCAGATRIVVGVRCRGRREPAESWWTSTMTVDDDEDGGGEDCAATPQQMLCNTLHLCLVYFVECHGLFPQVTECRSFDKQRQGQGGTGRLPLRLWSQLIFYDDVRLINFLPKSKGKQTLVAISEVTKQVFRADPDFDQIMLLDYARFLVVSLEPRTTKGEEKYNAQMAISGASWAGLLMDDTLTGKVASTDVATKENLQNLMETDVTFDVTYMLVFWPRIVMRKWLNIRNKESDFGADLDEGDTQSDSDDESWGSFELMNLKSTHNHSTPFVC
ncbi:hypothetical protein Syun_015393 [Stephania yunnanensis]|uniref:Uncharacterized protein n=1 Tax=Stephania yunnanensis TaxID=152371 RepID=A0AAP0JL35_9MAGN